MKALALLAPLALGLSLALPASADVPSSVGVDAGRAMKRTSPEPPIIPSEAPVKVADDGTVHANAPPRAAGRLPIFGLAADAGLPDGANLSLVVRPFSWLRVQGGMGNNGANYGWRAGATLLPFGTGPVVVAEYGRYRAGNVNAIASRLIGTGFQSDPLFDRVGYHYLNLHFGINFGYQHLVFFVQSGLSMVRGQTYDADQLVGTHVTVHSSPNIRATGVGGKLGFIAYVW